MNGMASSLRNHAGVTRHPRPFFGFARKCGWVRHTGENSSRKPRYAGSASQLKIKVCDPFICGLPTAERSLRPDGVGTSFDHLRAHHASQYTQLLGSGRRRGHDRSRHAQIKAGVLSNLTQCVRGMDRIEPQAGFVLVEAKVRLGCNQLAGVPQPQHVGRRATGGRDEVDALHQRTPGVLGAKHDGTPRAVVDHAAAVAAGESHLGPLRIRADLMKVVIAVPVDLHSAHEEEAELTTLREIVKLTRRMKRPEYRVEYDPVSYTNLT